MSKQWLYAIHTEIQRVGYYFLKGQTAPADKPLVPSKAGCSPPVNPGSLPHGTVIVLAGQGDGLWLPGLANFPVPTPQLPNSAAPPALGELDLGQRLLVGFWVNPWQNHALGKVSRFQLCNSATPQHPPPHLGNCRVGTQRVCEAPSPQLRSTPPRTWGVAELGINGRSRCNAGATGSESARQGGASNGKRSADASAQAWAEVGRSGYSSSGFW